MMEVLLQMFCSFFGTLMFSVLFNVQKKYYLGCGFAGMAGWMCYYICQNYLSPPMSCFFGTVVIVICSRFLSVWMKCPITVFLISGIFPLVPGAGVYNTAYHLVTGETALAAAYGMEALKNAFGIVLGIVFVLSVPASFFCCAVQKGVIKKTCHRGEQHGGRKSQFGDERKGPGAV